MAPRAVLTLTLTLLTLSTSISATSSQPPCLSTVWTTAFSPFSSTPWSVTNAALTPGLTTHALSSNTAFLGPLPPSSSSGGMLALTFQSEPGEVSVVLTPWEPNGGAVEVVQVSGSVDVMYSSSLFKVPHVADSKVPHVADSKVPHVADDDDDGSSLVFTIVGVSATTSGEVGFWTSAYALNPLRPLWDFSLDGGFLAPGPDGLLLLTSRSSMLRLIDPISGKVIRRTVAPVPSPDSVIAFATTTLTGDIAVLVESGSYHNCSARLSVLASTSLDVVWDADVHCPAYGAAIWRSFEFIPSSDSIVYATVVTGTPTITYVGVLDASSKYGATTKSWEVTLGASFINDPTVVSLPHGAHGLAVATTDVRLYSVTDGKVLWRSSSSNDLYNTYSLGSNLLIAYTSGPNLSFSLTSAQAWNPIPLNFSASYSNFPTNFVVDDSDRPTAALVPQTANSTSSSLVTTVVPIGKA